MFENIAGMSDAVKYLSRLCTIADAVYTDSGIRDKFEKSGKIAGKFTIEGYSIKFEIDRAMKEIPAEITEAANE